MSVVGELWKQNPVTLMEDTSVDAFKASCVWFDNFKNRTGVHSVVRNGKATNFDSKTTEDFVREFRLLFTCYENGLFLETKCPELT